jgi:hypothetical protein
MEYPALDKIPQASLARLHLLLDPDFEDAIPSPDELEFRYVLDGESLDYPLLYAMAGNELSDQHVAFRAPAQDITATGDAITLDAPSVLLTGYASWLYRCCKVLREPTFQRELARWKAGDCNYDPQVKR